MNEKTSNFCKIWFPGSLNSSFHLPVGFDFRLKQTAGIDDFSKNYYSFGKLEK